MLLLGGLIARVSAQNQPLSDEELNTLTNWFPAHQPQTLQQKELMKKYASPTAYETIAELADRVAKNDTVRALQINTAVLSRGNIERIAELKDLRVLHLTVDSATATEVLWRAVSQLKRLQRLSISQATSVAGQTPPITLPATLQQLTGLSELQLFISWSDWKQTAATIAGIPGLRRLVFGINTLQPEIPSDLGKVGQLTSLTIQSYQSTVLLPTSLGNLLRLKELNLSYVRLDQKQDWSFLNKLTGLETLRMASSNLEKLPDLQKLKKLRVLELSMSPSLMLGPDALNGLVALEKLNLSGCQLKQLPASITHLINLKELTVSNNPLIELPAQVGALTKLEMLNASGCRLQRLPESMGKLTQLQTLNMADNQLDSLSFDLGKLTQLRSVELNNNQIRELPATIGRLSNLRLLVLWNNKLKELPETVGDLTELTNLAVGANQLTRLPAGIVKTSNLQKLNVSENQLLDLPAEIGQLRRLKDLSLESNKLAQLPESLGQLDSLNWLDLRRNQLSRLPDGLFRLALLNYLNLSENKLERIPSALGRLTNLGTLSLYQNRLSSLPSELGKLTKLHALWLSDNPLELLPETIGECRELNQIMAKNTKLRVLPGGFTRLSKLQNLDLSGNELTILPAGLGNLTELRTLQLGRTRLLALPESIGRLTKLNRLQIGEMENISATEYAGLQQLPDSIVYCQELNQLQLFNQFGLDGDDTFAKISQLRNLRGLTLYRCNLERIPALDWKTFPVFELSLMRNRLTEVPIELLESPKLQQIALFENLLPKPLNTNFGSKEALRLAMSEAGLLALDKITKPNRGVATAFVQMAFQQAGQRNWTEALANFEKAIDYASDTLRISLYAQRADMHLFRQSYAEAVADYDQSIRLANQLTNGASASNQIVDQQIEYPTIMALRGRSHAKGKLGQIEPAMADINQAIQKATAMKADPLLLGSLYTEQGRYLTLQNKVKEANESYRKTIEEYEKMRYANPATKLTVVELYILIGEPNKARSALGQLNHQEMNGGFATLMKYLESSIQVMKNEKPDDEILADLNTYLANHHERIMGWSFELYENWLTRSGLPPAKQTTLQQLTQLAKSRLLRMD
ncbi:hypothetical protein GCM10027347_40570 [Larkinella harenae]